MFIGPEFAGQAYTRLYLIKNKKDFIFAANLPDLVNKLCSEMVITPLALYRFKDQTGNIASFFRNYILYLPKGHLLC